MPNETNKIAPLPVALIDDAINIIASAKHTNFTFGEVANVVQALNHFKNAGQAAREDGNQRAGELPQPVESDTSEPAPV
jgi:hypothetical protein